MSAKKETWLRLERGTWRPPLPPPPRPPFLLHLREKTETTSSSPSVPSLSQSGAAVQPSPETRLEGWAPSSRGGSECGSQARKSRKFVTILLYLPSMRITRRRPNTGAASPEQSVTYWPSTRAVPLLTRATSRAIRIEAAKERTKSAAPSGNPGMEALPKTRGTGAGRQRLRKNRDRPEAAVKPG